MGKETVLIGANKDTTWLQVTYTVALSTTAIIGRYEATKKHIIAHVLANIIYGRSGSSIGQVTTNPSEMSKSDWDAHVSDMTNNDLLGNMACWYALISEKKKLI